MRVSQEDPWAKIPHWVVMHPELDHPAIRVYGVLSMHANRARSSYPGIRTIAVEACMSRPTVIRALMQLETVGAVVVKRERASNNRHRVNQYHLPLNRPSGIPALPGGGQSVLPPGQLGLPPSGKGGLPELDLKNQLTRELAFENEDALPRLPGEATAAYIKRFADSLDKLERPS